MSARELLVEAALPVREERPTLLLLLGRRVVEELFPACGINARERVALVVCCDRTKIEMADMRPVGEKPQADGKAKGWSA